MGRLVVTEFVTLDGVAQSGGAPDEDRDGGFELGGWHAPFRDPEAGKAMFEAAESMDALLLGRRTYDLFARTWPDAPEEIPFTGLLNGVTKYVASRTLSEPLAWRGSTVLTQPVEEGVAALKDRHTEVHVIGSLNLVQSLLRFGLVDRLDLWLDPVVLGTGKKLFEAGVPPTALRLIDSSRYSTGILHLLYETTGKPTYGTVG